MGAPLPSLARWHTQGWTGVVIDYDQLVTRDFPDADLLDALRGVFHTLVSATQGVSTHSVLLVMPAAASSR